MTAAEMITDLVTDDNDEELMRVQLLWESKDEYQQEVMMFYILGQLVEVLQAYAEEEEL